MNERSIKPLPGRISQAQFAKILREAKPGRYNDRRHFDLELTRINGRVTAHMVYRFTLHGKLRWMGLGGARAVMPIWCVAARGNGSKRRSSIKAATRSPNAGRGRPKTRPSRRASSPSGMAAQDFLRLKAGDWNRVHRHQWDHDARA